MANVYIPPSQDARYIEGKSEFYIATQVEARNYIENGGFENGQDSWGFYGDTWLVPGKYGGYAMRLAATSFQDIETPLGSTYTIYPRCYLSFDAISASGNGTVRVELSDNAGGATISSKATPVTSGEWTRCTFEYTPTTAPHTLRFVPQVGTIYIDNVVMTTVPIDFHIPQPQAQALRIFDYENQRGQVLSAPGLMLRLTPLSDFNFRMSSVAGLGYESPSNNLVPMQTGESRFLSSIPAAKEFSITGTFSDSSPANLDRQKAALIEALSNGQKPIILAHRRLDCDRPVGDWGFIQAAYQGGLGLTRISNHIQDVSLDFVQIDPHVYYPPTSINTPSIGPLLGIDGRNIHANSLLFHPVRFAVRYKGTPLRGLAVSYVSYSTPSTYFGAVEDARGGLWIWGNYADQLGLQIGPQSTATSKTIFRLSPETYYPMAVQVTHASDAQVRGILPLPNGDVLIYGKFTSPGVGVARYNCRTKTLEAVGSVTTTDANFEFDSMAREGTRIWFTASTDVAFSGVSAGSDLDVASSVFYTDDKFFSATGTIVNTYYGSSHTPTNIQVESDDVGNLYVAVRTSISLEEMWYYKLSYTAAGLPSFSLLMAMSKTTTASIESYDGMWMVRRNRGVAVPFFFGAPYVSGSRIWEPKLWEVTDALNQRTIDVPDNSFVSGNSAYLPQTVGYSEEGSIYGYNTSVNRNLTYDSRLLGGVAEYLPDGRMLPAYMRRSYATRNWEIGNEFPDNGYHYVPVQTTITSPASARTSPILRIVGGGYLTHLGRIVNETNGSSIAFSGTLSPGDEFLFDPMDPKLPDRIQLLENRGPEGVFSLEPGTNSIIVHVNTIWAPISTSFTARTADAAVRHLEVDNLYTYQYTGRIRFTFSGSDILIQRRLESSLGSFTTNLTTANTTAPGSLSAILRILPTFASGGSGIGGMMILYNGSSYTAGSSATMRLPIVEMIVPGAALTIEQGTI